MIRLLRGLIYGLAAGIAAAFVIDYLDNRKREESSGQLRLEEGLKSSSATDSDKNDDLSDEARKALLDELGAQL